METNPASVIPLPDPDREGVLPVESALQQRRSVRELSSASLSLQQVAQLLWSAQGITHDEGLRTAPSAGALYPLEVYLVAGAVQQLPAGIYHYDPRRHALHALQQGDLRTRLAAAAMHQEYVEEAPAVLVITGIYARTEGKYGARAQRYVHLEAGHVTQNIYLQATSLKLGTVYVGAFDDAAVQQVLGLPADHVPLALMPVGQQR
jgi:SagB-type dehydrogenase family enzyme